MIFLRIVTTIAGHGLKALSFRGDYRSVYLAATVTTYLAAPPRRPPPTLGQHSVEVLRDRLGLTDEAIEKLRADGIIGTRPSFM